MHKNDKSCSQLIWPFCGLLQTVWFKTSKISYIPQLSAQISQMVFSAQMTVLRPLTTVWAKTSEMSYLREISAQVSKMVF